MKIMNSILIILGVIIAGLVGFLVIKTVFLPPYTLKDDASDPVKVPTSSVSNINLECDQNELILDNMTLSNIKEPVKYLEFKLNGTNNIEKNLIGEVRISLGSNHETKNIRIKDNLLRFKLVEVNENEENVLFTDKTYENLDNRTILVKNIKTKQSINQTYRLYMYVADNIKIGTTSNSDYTKSEWENNIYATIKITLTARQED